jgi:hypothetical protein
MVDGTARCLRIEQLDMTRPQKIAALHRRLAGELLDSCSTAAMGVVAKTRRRRDHREPADPVPAAVPVQRVRADCKIINVRRGKRWEFARR